MFTLLISLWISTNHVWAWGGLGHKIVAQYGTNLADPVTLANCHVTPQQLIEHTNDPDIVWRQQRIKHPHEGVAHFFHVDRQPSDWRVRKEAADLSQGFLVYKIVDWIDEAQKLRRAQKWDELAEYLYGLSHYVGDLVQPLHLFHDYNGREAGLTGIHSQFETKMLKRYEEQVRAGIQQRLNQEKIPSLWSGLDIKSLIFDTAQQTFSKAAPLLEGARVAYKMPTVSRTRSKTSRTPTPRFIKAILWRETGELAMNQLALGTRLWGHVLNAVCK